MRQRLTDEFLAEVLADKRPQRIAAADRGVPVRTFARWRLVAYKRFDVQPGKGVRPGWSRCPTCHQTVPPREAE